MAEHLTQVRRARRQMAVSCGPMDPSPTVLTAPIPAWSEAAPPPEAAWPLIGRGQLLSELVDGLVTGRRRAVALSGLGGVGKTRLAAEAARDLAQRFNGR